MSTVPHPTSDPVGFGDLSDTRAKHTPGPWTVVPGDSVVFIRNENATEAIAVTNRKRYFERHDETDLANARLMAAAPDMLAALKASRLYVETLEKHLAPTTDEAAPTIREHAAMVRAAIRKAEGRS